MPDAFFASTSKKRKRTSQAGSSSLHKSSRTKNVKGTAVKKSVSHSQRKTSRRDEELDSDATDTDIDDLDLRASEVDSAASDREEDVHETPAEKRLRLARIYLDGVKEDLALGEGDFDAAEIDRDIISARLKKDVLENAGKMHIFIAGSIAPTTLPTRLRVKGHRMAVTAAILSHDGTRLYMAGKEGSVSCYDVASGERLSYMPKSRPQSSASSTGGKGKGKGKALVGDLNGHSDEVLSLALSGDGKYLVSGGKDRRVGVWDVSDDNGEAPGARQKAKDLVWIKGFVGHKDTISSLSFRKSTNMLYSASSDRTIKLFDLSPGVMGYVETLFGHQDSIPSLDSLKGDTAVSCGGRDRTVRFWKITEETQLVFRGGGAGGSKARDMLEANLDNDEEDMNMEKNRKNKGRKRWVEGSVDCVAMVDEQTFLSGGDSGSIALWSTGKKKPVFTYTTAHGLDEMDSATEGKLRRPRWIMSLACLRYSDLFASGSWDGHIRLWKLDASLRSFAPVGIIDVPGLINSLQLLAIPKGWNCDSGWSQATPSASSGDLVNTPMTNGHFSDVRPARGQGRNEGVLLVAAVGREPRLGRWIRLRGEGIVNSAVVISLRTKTLE